MKLITSNTHKYYGLSTEIKPIDNILFGAEFIETDLQETYFFNGIGWSLKGYDQKSKIFLWNTETWEWEASTKGSGAGEAVSVENFPAVISGVNVPVKDTDAITVLQSILSKITGLVFVVELGSFVATIE